MDSSILFNEFKIKFNVDEYTIFKNKSWTWSLRPVQPTLGSGIISLNRYALQLSEVTPKEMEDLGALIQVVEKTTKESFNYDIMNYLMLMMVDHHVHYHVIPRYNGIRIFDHLEWVDNGWPAIHVLTDNQYKDLPENRKTIIKQLIKNL